MNKYLLPLFIFIIAGPQLAHSQSEDNAGALSRMDVSVFGENAFLNKAIVIDEMFEPFREKQKSSDGSYVYRESREWFFEMFNVLERADLKDRKKPEAVRAVLERTRKETVSSNVIPIGIINAEAVMLTEEQARENISAKSEGRRPDAASYEQLETYRKQTGNNVCKYRSINYLEQI